MVWLPFVLKKLPDGKSPRHCRHIDHHGFPKLAFAGLRDRPGSPSPICHFRKTQSGTGFGGANLSSECLRAPPPAALQNVLKREAAGELSRGGAPLFGRRRSAVSVTEDAVDPPGAIVLRPDHHELGDPLASPRRQVAEAVFAFLDCAIVLDRIDAERRRDQLGFTFPQMYLRTPSTIASRSSVARPVS